MCCSSRSSSESTDIFILLDIEADPSSVIEVIERGISDGEVEVDLSNSSIQVIFHECDVDLKWQFKLQKLTAKAFYEHVTKSILSLTCQLLDCHENLVDCVKRKDEELEDLYENGAASLSKSTLKTERFNSVLEFVKGKDGKDCDPFDILTNEKFYNLTKNFLRGNATEIKPIVHRNETQNRIEEQNEKVLVSPGKNLHVIKKRKIEQPPKSNVTRKKLQKL